LVFSIEEMQRAIKFAPSNNRMYTITISIATPADVPALNELINSAYRGESSKKGWTTEADLLGGIRTNETILNDLLAKPGAVLLVARNEEKNIVACVYLQKETGALYLGMLTVSPSLQAAGIGKQLIKSCRRICSKRKLSHYFYDGDFCAA
jgi:predicted N-acetyltransferase YhbS